MVTTDKELAELLVPETIRRDVGLVHPQTAATLILRAFNIGYQRGYQEALEVVKNRRKRKKANKQ